MKYLLEYFPSHTQAIDFHNAFIAWKIRETAREKYCLFKSSSSLNGNILINYLMAY